MKQQLGNILAEVLGAISAIAILTLITSHYTSAKNIQAQAQEGYAFVTQVATNVIDYYEENGSFPTSGSYNYGDNPGEYIASVVYNAPVSATTYGYAIATFLSGNGGPPHVVLKGKWIVKKFSTSGSHLVSNCYTNINASFMTGTTLAAGKNSEMVGHSCEIVETLSAVIDI